MTEINFEVYLSDDERKEIVREVFKSKVAKAMDADWERIFSNAAYQTVWTMVDAKFDGKAAEQIAQNAKRVISEMTEFSIFRRADAWHNKESIAYTTLQQAVSEQADAIRSRLSIIIAEMGEDHLREIVTDQANALLDEKLFGCNHKSA